MKIGINKSAKRVLSLVLAIMMIAGSLFIANIGVNIDTSAATEGTVLCWDGSTSTEPKKTDTDGAILVTSAAEFVWVIKNNVAGTTYRVDDGISAFVLQNYDAATAQAFMTLNTADEVAAWFADTESRGTPHNWAAGVLNGTFDGNGVTVYGLYCTGVNNAGLFASMKPNSVFKNFAIENSYVIGASFAGVVAGIGFWNSEGSITIENCDVRNNYIDVTAGNLQMGILVANVGDAAATVRNCLVVDNKILKQGAAATGHIIQNANPKLGVVENCIAIGCYPTVGGSSKTKFVNAYSDQGSLTSGVDSSVSTQITVASVKGITAKATASKLNWATDAENGEGYWHVMANDYPTPLKPEGWQDIVVMPVWDGTAADSFARGSGTEEDPYIIETAEQLYKMAISGGREATGETKAVKLTVGITDASGNMLDTSGKITTDASKQAYQYSDETVEVPVYRQCYYKVADGVTDLYLNNVQGGNLDTLKSLVTAGTAKNWNKSYDGAKEKSDTDGDGFFDEASAFRGVFDGNGVTIHGLYTAKGISTSWLAYGDGFLPAIKGNAIVKNVNFDTTYINPSTGYGGVLTSSLGLDGTNNNAEGNSSKGALGDNCTTTNATIANVAVRNTYIAKGGYSTQNSVGDYSKGGIIASHGSPKKLAFINCLYDGTGSELLYDTNDNTAGIFAATHTASTVTLVNCVSIGLQPVACSLQESKAKFVNCYTTVTDFHSNNSNDDVIRISEYDSQDDLSLLNWGVWGIETVENSRKLPMPGITKSTVSGYSNIKEMVLEQVGKAGLYSYTGAKEKGTYGHYDKLIGSGTAADPYLISTPTELANAIAVGGKNVTQKLHYKLTNDINLGSLAWIDTVTVSRESEGFDEYRYTAFEGVLDGDGYTIYELNATATNSGALIPVLNGGTVKNLHIRNSAANVAIFAEGSGTVENCSAINCYVATEGGALTSGGATAKNSVFNDTYYLENGEVGTAVLDGVTWYGIAGKTPHLVNNAKSMQYADVNGDGKGEPYGAADLTALRNKLLKKQDYTYVYGDVNKDGKTNLSDLVTLSRYVVDDYNHVKDGFWRNLELGNFSIYYGENDNYDAARKLELYLEAAVPGLDVTKVVSADNTVSGDSADKTAVYVHSNDTVGTPDGKLEIIVGNLANYGSYATNTKATAANSYAITYDKENGVLWLQGENFTAVEQAVLDFIDDSDAKTATVYTTDNATLVTEKQPVTIDGTTYYYTWGDEFNGEELVEDNWLYNQMGSETAYEKGTHEGKYVNLEHPFNKELDKLYVVEGGKLVIKRGAYTSSDAALDIVQLETPDFGDADYIYNEQGNKIDKDDIYVSAGDILSEKSLLVKQGYFEFKAALPSDGHAFMSWWMMGVPNGGNNNAYANSLYGKVYKLNPNFSGVNAMDSQNAKETYKYQLPNAYFEIDIIELLQDITRFTDTSTRQEHMTGICDYNLQLNMHKYVDTGATAANGYKYSVLDWSTGEPTIKQFKLFTGSTTSFTQLRNDSYYPLTDYLVVDGSDDNKDGIMSSNVKNHDFGVQSDYTYNATSHQKLTAMRRYGFEWEVVTDANGVGTAATYTLYVWDPDGDGESDADDYAKYSVTCDKTTSSISYNETLGTERLNTTYHTDLYYLNQLIPDCEVSNQYMHFIIDNIYYAANQYRNNQNFTDLLTYENSDKTTLDIDYLRVYQADGKRDIITPETEAFNNGNHFGY